MVYTKNPTWADGSAGGTPITADRLNHLEDGVVVASALATAANPDSLVWLDADVRAMRGASSSTALVVPTHVAPSGGQVTHPSIAYIPRGLNGYRYWMAITPYTGGNDAQEDPNIVASNDGITWVVPAGLTNPLDDKPGGGDTGSYNSDVCLVYGTDGLLHLWFRYYNSAATGAEETIKHTSSPDGVTWSPIEVVITNAKATRRLLAPTVVEEDGQWVMWAVDMVPSPNRIVQLTAPSPSGPWSAPTNCTITAVPTGQEPWHPEVRYIGGTYVMLLNTCTLDAAGSAGQLILATSKDGIAWTGGTDTVIPKVNGSIYDSLYKSSFLPAVGPDGRVGFAVWYTGWKSGTTPVWNLYHTFLANPAATGGGSSGPAFDVTTGTATGVYTLSEATAHKVTMTANTTFNLPNPSKAGCSILLYLTGPATPTFPTTVQWEGGAEPTYTSEAAYRFTTFNSGATWLGQQLAAALTPPPPPPSVADYAAEVTADAPAAWYRMDATGSTLADASGNSRDLTVTGSVTATAGATANTGAATTWASAVAKTAANATWWAGTAITLEAWVKTSSKTTQLLLNCYNATFTGADSNQRGYLGINATGNAYCSFAVDGQAPTVVSPAVVADGAWHHIVAVRDGASLTLYVDKTLVASTTSIPATAQAAGTQPLCVGATRNNSTTTLALNGSLDEVAVYTKALSPARIAAHYDAAKAA